MTTKILLEMDTAVVKAAHSLAAQQGLSLDQLLGHALRSLVEKKSEYDAAKARALTRLERGSDLNWTPPTSRDELHAR